MIEVIENKWKPEFPQTVVCKECTSYLRITNSSDITNRTKTVKGKKIKYKTIYCPCCYENAEFDVVELNISEVNHELKENNFINKENIFTD